MQQQKTTGNHLTSAHSDIAKILFHTLVRVLLAAPDNDNPNLVPIWDGFGFLVYL